MSNTSWKHVVPHLAALHRAGHLVPFVGSGMSHPICTDWTSFVRGLCNATRIHWQDPPVTDGEPKIAQEELLRRADDATRVLRSWPHSRRREALKSALFSTIGQPPSVPEQSLALAEFRWPLVITTNYEDVFWHAARSKSKSWNRESRESRDDFEVRGRSLSDCHAVLRSLDWPSSPILWAMQGFLGGPYRSIDELVPDSARRESLLGELVIGHRQYQEATHLNPHFRRAFAEVFRRRALLFLGSGITEAYLTSLFSEVLMMQGQRAGSHFALMPSWEVNETLRRFLSDRLGILTCVYERYSEIEDFLGCLLANTKHFMPASFKSNTQPVDAAVEISSISYRMMRGDGAEVTVVLENRAIVDDPKRQRVLWAISVGRSLGSSGDQLYHGSMSKAALQQLGLLPIGFSTRAIRDYLYTHADDGRLIAVAARPGQDDSVASPNARLPDPRALADIRGAMLALLDHAAASKDIDIVRVGLLSAGPSAPWHPIFSLVLMLAAIRDFAQKTPCSVRVEITVVDSRVWTRVVSGTLPVQEILSSARLPVLVRIESGDTVGGNTGGVDTVVYMADEGSSLSDVFEHLQLDSIDWRWSMVPAADSRPLVDQQPSDVSLIPYATIVLQPRASDSD